LTRNLWSSKNIVTMLTLGDRISCDMVSIQLLFEVEISPQIQLVLNHIF
jgi:hypothetical protein